jgi:hypothetical protein
MSDVKERSEGEALEKLIASGDLSKLTPEERVQYYFGVCRSLGLNPFTNPLKYIVLQGKLTLYASRDACDQLRKIHGISIDVKSREFVNGLYVVTVRAEDAKGRHHESIGAVPVEGLKGEQLANALMKAETKASRRATLALCGLGFLDETEVESLQAIGTASPPKLPKPEVEGEQEQEKVEAVTLDEDIAQMNKDELVDSLKICMEMAPGETEVEKRTTFLKWVKEVTGKNIGKFKDLPDDELRVLVQKARDKWCKDLLSPAQS